MSGFFGGGAKTNASTTKTITGLQIQTSALNVPITLVWGKKRISANIFWYDDFKAIPEKNGGKKGGGKGGDGKGAGGVVYDYFVAVMLGLCEGTLTGIDRVWSDRDLTSLSALGLTLFPGTASQAPWSYLTSNHPDQARSYAYTSYLANSSYSLGKSPNLPNNSFEAITELSGSMPDTVDVNMADVIDDFLTNPQYSIGFPSSGIDPVSLDFYRTYTRAQGLFFSPDITSQEQVSAVIGRWADLTNTWIFWSGASMKFVPLGDSEITANGVTFTPVLSVRYELGYEDFISDATTPPITVTSIDPADAPNHVNIECKDRVNSYNAIPAEWKDQGLIDQYGNIDGPVTQAAEICDIDVGMVVAQLIGQRKAYILNTYEFKLGWEFCLLEPGDIVNLTDPHIGLDSFRVRIRTMEEDEEGNWSVTAEEFPDGIGTAIGTQPGQSATNTPLDLGIAPGPVNKPAIFEPSSDLTHGIARLMLAASGGADWGGCVVNISFDPLSANYASIGTISNPAPQGELTATLADHADPDGVNTLSIDLTSSQVVLNPDATHDDADAFRTLMLVTPTYTTTIPSDGEMIAYGEAVLGGGSFDFDLSYLRRGLYGTAHASHASGDLATRFDLNQSQPPGNTVLVYDLPPQYIGQTIYLKFVSFNRFGNSPEDISTVTAYTYTPTGVGFGGGASGVPTTPTGLAASSGLGQNVLTWSNNPSTDNVEHYEAFAAVGLGQVFGSASLIGTSASPNFIHTGLTAGTQWTYFVKAHNQAGDSSATAGVDCTTNATAANRLRISGNLVGAPSAGQTLFEIEMVGGESLPAGLAGAVAGCNVAPTGAVTLPLKNNGTAVGSIDIAAGATVATFTLASAITFAAGDLFKGEGVTDATLSGLHWTLIGSQ